MVTTGTKLYFGLALVAFFAAVVYGVITNGVDHGGVMEVISGPGAVNAVLGPVTFGYKGGIGDHLGYIVLMGFSFSCLGLGVATSAFRDADPESLAELAGTDNVAVIVAPAGLSFWPTVAAVGLAMVMVGLAVGGLLVAVGSVLVVIAGLEWTIQSWSDMSTGDPEVNRTARNRLMLPIEIPVGGLLAAGVVVFCISRILLASSKLGAVWVALAVGLVIFVGALVLNAQQQLKRQLVVGVLVIFAVGILAVGIGGAIAGTHEHEGEKIEGDSAGMAGVGETGK